jgi:hypothetical protein
LKSYVNIRCGYFLLNQKFHDCTLPKWHVLVIHFPYWIWLRDESRRWFFSSGVSR